MCYSQGWWNLKISLEAQKAQPLRQDTACWLNKNGAVWPWHSGGTCHLSVTHSGTHSGVPPQPLCALVFKGKPSANRCLDTDTGSSEISPGLPAAYLVGAGATWRIASWGARLTDQDVMSDVDIQLLLVSSQSGMCSGFISQSLY